MSTTFDLSKCERNAQGHWLCQTRDGREARVICADIKGRQDLLALITNLAGIEYSITLFKDGRYSPTEDTANDLINLPRKFRFERWANVPEDFEERGLYPLFKSKAVADSQRSEGAGRIGMVRGLPFAIACVKVVIEGEYGQGLGEGE